MSVTVTSASREGRLLAEPRGLLEERGFFGKRYRQRADAAGLGHRAARSSAGAPRAWPAPAQTVPL